MPRCKAIRVVCEVCGSIFLLPTSCSMVFCQHCLDDMEKEDAWIRAEEAYMQCIIDEAKES